MQRMRVQLPCPPGLVTALRRIPGWASKDGLRDMLFACALMGIGVCLLNSNYQFTKRMGAFMHTLSALYADVIAIRAIVSFLYREWKNGTLFQASEKPKKKNVYEGEEVGTCCVCIDSKVTHVMVACGHACTCTKCSVMICESPAPTCPVCRSRLSAKYSNTLSDLDDGPFRVVLIENAADFGVKRVIVS